MSYKSRRKVPGTNMNMVKDVLLSLFLLSHGVLRRKNTPIHPYSTMHGRFTTAGIEVAPCYQKFLVSMHVRISLVRELFYKKLKNVSCEYDRLNGWNSLNIDISEVFVIKCMHMESYTIVRYGDIIAMRGTHAWDIGLVGIPTRSIFCVLFLEQRAGIRGIYWANCRNVCTASREMGAGA